ncbi:MAG: hypothetical protein NTX97_01460 [Bacteroidetes bacterium]|nr:hypothetical protein [Bacteroidota bacterium]
MKSKVFKIILLFAAIIYGPILKAQEINGQTYVITNNGSVTDVQPYIDALNNSDMKNQRLKNTRNTIVFKTGVAVQLFSASEINTAGHILNLSDYPEHFETTRDIPAFSLGPNNFIMEEHHVTGKFH